MVISDEEAAVQAIATLDSLSQDQEDAKNKINSILASPDPFINIHDLFGLYNILYFRSLLLPRVEVSWSARMTSSAGLCELVRDPNNGNEYTRIRLKLSEPLLKLRPQSDVVNTLLHEAIHAYFFITTSWYHTRGEDGTGHGPGFLLLADAINNHGNYHVTVHHAFHDEVESYKTHVWQCGGVCRSKPPLFGLVKRSMNRAPGKSDPWWQRHQTECGGQFEKIAEPDLSKARIEKMGGLKKAGRQSNKIDAWLSSRKTDTDSSGQGGHKTNADVSRAGEETEMVVECPICNENVALDAINDHLDQLHPP